MHSAVTTEPTFAAPMNLVLESVVVVSAGVAAGEGSMASQQAIEVMEARGIDISDHLSRPLNEAIVDKADVILTMTRGHRAAIIAAWPDRANQVQKLNQEQFVKNEHNLYWFHDHNLRQYL